MSRIYALLGVSTASTEVRRSRFLATAGPANDEEEAKSFIAAHSDAAATHNCWAWRIGRTYRFNDDGEPGGTAGKPILQAIDGQSLDRVAVVVTRWFGGILLGSGGLIRAYGGAAAQCLRAADKAEQVELAAASFACEFGDLAILTARLAAVPGLVVTRQDFTAEGAVIDIAVPLPVRAEVERLVADITSGRSSLAWA